MRESTIFVGSLFLYIITLVTKQMWEVLSNMNKVCKNHEKNVEKHLTLLKKRVIITQRFTEIK